ncbi:3-phosphoglycerate dehydrogenase family protein [Marispirochaeta sp.]|jgi:D-3-phosphoglycerate dehydrogenase / 2-oxoglutarate reductase|uniref:3-phosphoglycerate dehydrogenase family protein n=1 Tax=Marispirochaeta sp. TaxID=2038653 RepID=UPI0029C8E4D2|nr:3-phosphoglycerate dehydrogenase family protein [Marispirochaeta sp.]
MYKILTLNKISAKGLDLFSRDEYEVASEIGHPDAIIVRSQDMHSLAIPDTVKAIARAGAGTNNIPVKVCSERGIAVFNTPGANANSVKELTLTGMFLASRKIFRGMQWVKSLAGKGDEIPALIEKGKKEFTGNEIRGKKLGVIGLGAIGVDVANDAERLGMIVSGYDPFISVEAAWGLSPSIKKAETLEALVSESDYITIHIPLNNQTRGILNTERFARMKKGVKILNFSRGGLVNNADMLEAIQAGIVDRYVTDFPDDSLLQVENVIPIPHLGASTPEAEENCAVMASRQLITFLETGNITNSVNFPDCSMPLTTDTRIIIANKNIPNMVGQITTILAEESMNISEMINRHKDGYAYNIIDVEAAGTDTLLTKLKGIEGVVMARIIDKR